MKKELASADEALEFMAELIMEQKWLILPAVEKDGKFTVEWIEHKTYTAQDGQEYPDEVWVTKEGTPMLIQDMSEAHVRNVLRMLLRNQRMVAGLERMAQVIEAAQAEMEEPLDLDSIPDDTGNEADNQTVKNLKDLLRQLGDRDDELQVPNTAVKGPSTLQ